MDVRALVRSHYSSAGLSQAVLDALTTAGVDVNRLGPTDLYPVDHLHAGGAPATQYLLDRLGVEDGMRLLDVGSGIGGPARMAAMNGAVVTGIDLTPEFVDASTDLTALVGLAEKTEFLTSSGDSLPFDDGAFEAAMMVHVGMNIPEKEQVFAEVHRVLAPGARFALYEQMSNGTGDLSFPMPWAEDPKASFLENLEDYRRHLETAGFRVDEVEDRTEAALEGRPQGPITPADVFGPTFAEGVGNYASAARSGQLRAILLLASA